jgi:hypothetical protein
MSYNSIYRRDLFRDRIVVITGGGRDQPVRSHAQPMVRVSRLGPRIAGRKGRQPMLLPPLT